ncbi:MAG: aldo/keto reductase [Spirochaetia bacterium]
MQYRQLGKNGPEVSVIGFGAWPIGGGMGAVEQSRAERTVRSALDEGITLIDTAQAYRDSESFLGAALEGVRRDSYVLATKASFDFSPEGIRKAIETSLRELRTDYVDVYQLHSFREPLEPSIETLIRLREEGKTRFVGVSNYTFEQLRRTGIPDGLVSNQVAYNLFDRAIEDDLIPREAQAGVSIMAHSPLDKGTLTGKYDESTVFPEDDERSSMPRFQGEEFRRRLAAARRLASIAAELDMSLVQLAVAWTLRHPDVATTLVGAKSPEQVREHAAVNPDRLTGEVLGRIEAALAH